MNSSVLELTEVPPACLESCQFPHFLSFQATESLVMYTFNQTSLVNAKSNKFSVRYQQHQCHLYSSSSLFILLFNNIPIVSDGRLKWGKEGGKLAISQKESRS